MDFYKFPRLYNHIASLALIGAVFLWIRLYLRFAGWFYISMLATGYAALLLTALTLSIGTVMLFFRRKNPVNLYVRRDMGIWAGITGVIHAVLGFFVHTNRGPFFISYYVRWTSDGAIRPFMNRFGFNNYTGTVAVLIMIVLLLTSNTLSLRWLKGRRWKTLQRWNYALALFAALHTIGYQQSSRREPPFVWVTVTCIAVVVAAQLIGIMISRQRKKSPARVRSAA